MAPAITTNAEPISPPGPLLSRPPDFITGVENPMGPYDIIVSKTDTKGRITYANRTFIQISGYTEAELLGAPQSIVRHPDMPRAVFKVLWNTISSGRECFAYVVNRCKTGDHYWVFAHITPITDANGVTLGYHSNRRAPDRDKLPKIIPLYQALREAEKPFNNPQQQLQASMSALQKHLTSIGMEYDQFIQTV